ncbi:hypothetical protein NliqN6_1583 [Naganishia liquefaciens]|uniref:Uncharacterized protein n=1 Tax=Naganishia liquefaciens TaxID=104408 RepID=A0A8H3YEY7_9TREE|nr:hypothetical protein NliqN6_1583 [Naganishia liquefaciens]
MNRKIPVKTFETGLPTPCAARWSLGVRSGRKGTSVQLKVSGGDPMFSPGSALAAKDLQCESTRTVDPIHASMPPLTDLKSSLSVVSRPSLQNDDIPAVVIDRDDIGPPPGAYLSHDPSRPEPADATCNSKLSFPPSPWLHSSAQAFLVTDHPASECRINLFAALAFVHPNGERESPGMADLPDVLLGGKAGSWSGALSDPGDQLLAAEVTMLKAAVQAQ